MICLKMHLKTKNPFGGSPEPPEVSGGAPCQTDMDCIERVKVGMAKIKKLQIWLQISQNNVSSQKITIQGQLRFQASPTKPF